MTERLVQRFRERFPPINGYERVTIYEAYERIYLDLIEQDFMPLRHFNPHREIKDLALKTFDVSFICKFLDNGGWNRLAIIFSEEILPKGKMSYELFRYNLWYDGHGIEVSLPATHPIITVSTGNRGRTDLLDRQRDLYYNFVEGIYNIFLEKVKSSKFSR